MITLDKVKSNYLLISILVLGAILRFYHLDFQSVWLDEIHTLNDANPSKSMSEVYASVIMSDQHPPLYFYIIHFLFKIFGYTPIVARVFSAVVGVASIYAIYRLGKELLNKEVGIISALLLAINGFIIYHSQDARPYTLLCFATIVSFYYLIKFIKNPCRKNALLYGVFGALMLYGHFFALFALLSQLAILLFFFVISEKSNKKGFFINVVISGLVMAVLFLPALKIFIAATKIKDFWIAMPTPDVYTLIFNEFFGNSEMILCLIGFVGLLYIIKISNEPEFPINYNSVIENKMIFGFIILAPWIVIVLLVPLIRSYLSIPVIISRYFIDILPAILIVVSIGIFQFKNQIVKLAFIALFFVFTFTDMLVVKKYYTTVYKTQFREVTQFIIDNNKNNEPVVTSLPWYFPYFLNNDKYKYTIVGNTLDEYVQTMVQDSTKAKPFWYVDAHARPYKVSEQTQKFLDEHFIVENNIELRDCWTKHYVNISAATNRVDISKYQPLKDVNGDKINFWIDKFETTGNEVSLAGWAYLDGQDATNTNISLALISEGKATKIQSEKIARTDITNSVGGKFKLDNSGFSSKIALDKLQPGKYRLAIYLVDKGKNKEGLILTDKVIDRP